MRPSPPLAYAMVPSLCSGVLITSPARCIHHPRHDASSAGYRLLASFAPGVASHEPSPCRSPAFAPSVRRLGPDLPLRRVFVRSFCARRRPVSELNPRQMCRDAIRRYMTLIDPNCFANNFVRTVISFLPRLISAWKFRYNMPNAVKNEESERKRRNER